MEDLGVTAYEIYRRAVNFKNHLGNDMPDWMDLPTKIQNAWTEVGNALVLIGNSRAKMR